MSWSRLYDFEAGNPARSAEVDAELNQLISAVNTLLGTLMPIGSIVPFYDFDGALTFDTSIWAYCDGSSATVGGSSRTLPDLSGRYLVGFGTDGGGDLDTATWDTAAVGNASHQADLAHTHDSGTLKFVVARYDYTDPDTTAFYMYDSGGTERQLSALDQALYTVGGVKETFWDSVPGSDYTFYTSTGSGATASSLSATQSIQPRSIRVRYLMRKA